MNSNKKLAVIWIVFISGFAGLAGYSQGVDSGHESFGFVRLLNAVGVGAGKLDFMIDGKSIRPSGYQLGNVTGGIALKPGTHKVVVRRDGVGEGSAQIQVTANDTCVLIPFAEQVPATDKQPVHWDIRILRLKQHESEDKRTASFVSVSREPELKVEVRQADGTWVSVYVKRLSVARTEIQQARGYMTVRCNGRELSPLSVAAAGNFVSVLYEDENGVLQSKAFQDYKYLSAE
jgi:hypothetical protein